MPTHGPDTHRMNISLKDSSYLKGVAILLMLWHHLFAFPERLGPGVAWQPVWPGVPVEQQLALFGKICVPMFLFLSGYGLARSQRQDYLRRALHFIGTCWFYFAVFVPIGLIWFADQRMFEGDALRFVSDGRRLLSNLFFINTTYNGEWWFGRLYLELMLVLVLLGRWRSRGLVALLGLSLLAFAAGVELRGAPGSLAHLTGELLLWQWPFALGWLSARHDLGWLHTPRRIMLLIWALLCGGLYLFGGIPGLIVAVPFFVLLLLGLPKLPDSGVLQLLGRYSSPMWLVHSFFCYYYAQPLVYAPGNPLLVLLLLTLFSLGSAMVLEHLRLALLRPVERLLQRLRPAASTSPADAASTP